MKLLKQILEAVRSRKLPRQFRDGALDVQLWRDCFGDDFPLADRTLCIFCDAFMFDPVERFRFRPDDTVMAVYQALYPSEWMADALEHTFLIEGLEKEFGFTFDQSRCEKIESFRQIVAEIKSAQPSSLTATSRLDCEA